MAVARHDAGTPRDGRPSRAADAAGGTLRFSLVRKIAVDPSGVAGSVDGVEFSKDGMLLAAGDLHAEARIYRTSDGSFLRKVTHHPGIFGRAGELNAIGFSHDGKYLFTGIDDRGAKIWNVADGTLIKHLGDGSSTDGADFAPNGRWFAAAKGAEVVVYGLPGFEVIKSIRHASGTQEVNSIDFSTDSSLLASAGGDGRLLLIRTSDWTVARTMSVGSSIKSVRLSPDGALVAYGARGKKSGVFRVSDGMSAAKLIHTGNTTPLPGDDDDTDPAIEAVAWTAAGTHLLTSGLIDGVMSLWRRSDWTRVATVQAQEKNRGIEYIDTWGDLVVAGGDEGNVYLFRLDRAP